MALLTSSVRPTTGRPGRQSGDDEKRWRGGVVANLIVVLLLVMWWWVSRTAPSYIVPSPQSLLPYVRDLLIGDLAFETTYTSLARVLVSVALAVLIGLALASIGRSVPILRPFIADRVMPFLNAFPSLGWAFLGVIWFGISTTSVIFMETAMLIPFTLVTVWEGYKALDKEALEMADSYTRSKRRRYFRIELPLLRPYIAASVRTSYGVGWKIALIAEIFGATSGLGNQMNVFRQNFNTAGTLACVVVVVLLVYAVDKFVFQTVQRRLQRGL
jgi:NitT/TauT family transport system permease protein/sulfonate transport system permease protein